MKIIFGPEADYKKQIEFWLSNEFYKNGEGLYHNFIYEDLSRNNFLCCIDNGGLAVGFIVYAHRTTRATINLASVKSSEKRRGICRLMLKALEKRLIDKGIMVVELFCSPKTSERVWIKLGFRRFAERESHAFLNSRDLAHPYLYKPIVSSLKPSRSKKLISYLELWAEPEHVVASNQNLNPTYRWNIANTEIPVIYPVDGEWKIRYVLNGNLVWTGKMDRFIYSFSDHGNFLIFMRSRLQHTSLDTL